MKDGYIRQAWLVLVLALCFGAALAGMEAMLAGRIRENKTAETHLQIPLLAPPSEAGLGETIAGRNLYRATVDGRHVGWVVPAGGQGFADKIELLIGLDADAKTITGLYVLDQKETPGLGNCIINPQWLGQFTGKATDRALEVIKSGQPGENQILAVTGATISSESVCKIVNETMSQLREALAAEARKD